jgi:hypothetical protein
MSTNKEKKEEKQFSWDDLTKEEIEQEQQKRLEEKRKAAE